jgi:signal transduction histidine kinase
VVAAPVNLFVVAAAVVVAVYSVAAHASSWEAAVTGGVVALGLAVAWASLDPAPQNESVANVVFVVLVWGCGAAVRRQAGAARATRAAAEARAGELLRDERARIARELHDVVAHGIAVSVLQARGGRKVLVTDPDAAATAFTDIERVSAQSLAEMRRLVAMLRVDGAHGATSTREAGADGGRGTAVPAPQPGLRHLDGLVSEVRAAGLAAEVSVAGEPRDLPPGLDLSAYRIVQEALTNVLRHAPGARARVTVGYAPGELTLRVVDDGPAVSGPPGPAGHGVTGMRERAALFGGTLECGPRPGGGYGVLARFPVPP